MVDMVEGEHRGDERERRRWKEEGARQVIEAGQTEDMANAIANSSATRAFHRDEREEMNGGTAAGTAKETSYERECERPHGRDTAELMAIASPALEARGERVEGMGEGSAMRADRETSNERECEEACDRDAAAQQRFDCSSEMDKMQDTVGAVCVTGCGAAVAAVSSGGIAFKVYYARNPCHG